MMEGSFSEQIMERMGRVAELYHRLIMLVAPAGAGKTTALQDVHRRTGYPLVNVNLLLSRCMLDLTERQRRLQLPRLFSDIVNTPQGDTILLDNIEVIFDVTLKQDPLRLLQGLSRNKTVVAAWNGTIVESSLTYAVPDHPEYRRYPMHDFLVVSPGVTT